MKFNSALKIIYKIEKELNFVSKFIYSIENQKETINEDDKWIIKIHLPNKTNYKTFKAILQEITKLKLQPEIVWEKREIVIKEWEFEVKDLVENLSSSLDDLELGDSEE